VARKVSFLKKEYMFLIPRTTEPRVMPQKDKPHLAS
jgi:hypothetical protein